MVFRPFRVAATSVLVRRDREGRDVLARRQRPQLRVACQPSDEHHLVHSMAPSIITAHRGRARPLDAGGYRWPLIAGLLPDYRTCLNRGRALRVSAPRLGAGADRGDR